MDRNQKPKHRMTLLPAVLIFLVIGGAIAVQKVLFKGDMGAMFLILWVVLIPIGIFFGKTAEEMEEYAIRFTSKASSAVFVMLTVGALISCWIASGTTPAIIYYGIRFINPKIFLVTAMLLCAVVSMLSGTSNGACGTAGVAMMGIGHSLGIPAPITAGAVICGAFFGDKMSPMSDTTILASSISEVNIFTHIRHMVYDQVPALLISLLFFLVLGFKYSGQISSPEVDAMMAGLQEHFRLGFAAFIPLLITGVLLFRRLPALLCMLAGAVSGIAVAIFYQGMDAAAAFNTFYGGYRFETSNAMLSTLLNRGGISSMWSLVGVTLFGFTVAGMLDQLKVLEVIAASIMKTIRSITGVTVITILFGFIGNAVALSQNFAIVMSGTLMAPVYRKYNLHPKNCSRDLEAGGTYGAMFIPWNNNAIFCAGALGVGVTSYIPYIPLLYLTPVIVILFSVFRFKMEKIYDDCGYTDVTGRLEEDPEMQERLQG